MFFKTIALVGLVLTPAFAWESPDFMPRLDPSEPDPWEAWAREKIDSVDVAFEGTLQGAEHKSDTEALLTFTVSQWWKGSGDEIEEISTRIFSEASKVYMQNAMLEEGAPYLIFAEREGESLLLRHASFNNAGQANRWIQLLAKDSAQSQKMLVTIGMILGLAALGSLSALYLKRKRC
jgi:hypothetical protein